MNSPQPVELPSHELLSQLARDDPQAYEALRREVIDSFIASAPEGVQPRLRGIQFRVENVRRMSRSALGSTVKVYELMWESFRHLNDNWQALVKLKEGGIEVGVAGLAGGPVSGRGATVLEFRPRKTGGQDSESLFT